MILDVLFCSPWLSFSLCKVLKINNMVSAFLLVNFKPWHPTHAHVNCKMSKKEPSPFPTLNSSIWLILLNPNTIEKLQFFLDLNMAHKHNVASYKKNLHCILKPHSFKISTNHIKNDFIIHIIGPPNFINLLKLVTPYTYAKHQCLPSHKCQCQIYRGTHQ